MLFRILLIVTVISAHVQWKDYEEGLKEMKSSSKPGLVLIYRPTCPACKRLQMFINNSGEIEELSKQFVMIKCDEGHAPRNIDYRGGTKCILLRITQK